MEFILIFFQVVQRKVCEDVEKSFISYVPDEHCELEPYEVCNFVQKQYPTLVEEEFCKTVPRETCDPERVLPKQETKPLIKKVCVENSGDDMGITTQSPDDEEDFTQTPENGDDDDSFFRLNDLETTDQLPIPLFRRNGKIMKFD